MTNCKTKKRVSKLSSKKKSLRPLHLLRKDLDILFSQYIRLRDADNAGNIRCCTTNKLIPWKDSNAGHFFSKRGNPALIFEESNVNAQSRMANRLQRNNITWDYLIYMEKKWGRKELDRLASLRNIPFKFTREWLMEKIEHYAKEVEKLKNEKNYER
jgi:hypothetical protein